MFVDNVAEQNLHNCCIVLMYVLHVLYSRVSFRVMMKGIITKYSRVGADVYKGIVDVYETYEMQCCKEVQIWYCRGIITWGGGGVDPGMLP